MRKKLAILILSILIASANAASAQNGNSGLLQLNEKLLKLQQQIFEMQKKHDAEIAALKKQIRNLSAVSSRETEDGELTSLRELAKTKAAEKTGSKEKSEETTFTSGGLSLQALNPEISVVGDFLYSYKWDTTSDKRSDFNMRTLGIHVNSWLDPYTRLKASLGFHEDDVELGEAYITLYNIADNLNLTLGKFRQQFGVVNRWHKHALDQVDFPVALREIFGEGGLNQSGLSLDWMMPPIADTSQQLTFQLTDGSNDRLFSENDRNRPSLLLHYKNYRDLSKDTYLEWGLSGLVGWNNEWNIQGGPDRDNDKTTIVLGVDMSMLWEPTEKMRYQNIEWRSEAYLLNKNLLAPDGSGSDSIHAWGLYSYLMSKISRTLDVGIRGDFFVPDTKSYANLSRGLSLSPLAVTADNPYLWQVCPYITWWQSPFVKFRLEYNNSGGKGISNTEDIIWLQAVFAAGPHKHDRY